MDGGEVKISSVFFFGVRRYDSQTIKKMRTYLQVNLETSLDQDLVRSQSFSPILSGASGHLWTCLPSGFIATCWCYVWKSIAPFVDLEIQLRNCLTIAHPHVLQNLKLNPLQLHICFLEAFLSNLVYIHIYIYIKKHTHKHGWHSSFQHFSLTMMPPGGRLHVVGTQ